MPDDQGQDQPTEFERVSAQLNQLTQGLGQFARGVDQRFAQLAQNQPAPAQPAPPQMPADAGTKILEELGANPVRWVGELAANIEQRVLTKAEQLRQNEQKQAWERAQVDQFWNAFQYHNQDLAPFMPQVFADFQRFQNIPDASDRANQAAANVRQLLAQQRADAVEAERRQSNGRRLMTIPPGFPLPQSQERPGENESRMTREERAAELQQEQQAFRARTNWDTIAKSPHYQQAQANKPRVIERRRA